MPAWLTGVTAIAAGAYQPVALKGDGTVAAWGCKGPMPQCAVHWPHRATPSLPARTTRWR
ncbi:MAG: hypothetical protein U0841_21930 [Chloroflexia bacterium]